MPLSNEKPGATLPAAGPSAPWERRIQWFFAKRSKTSPEPVSAFLLRRRGGESFTDDELQMIHYYADELVKLSRRQ